MSNKKKKKNRIKYNRIRDFSDCSLLSWNNWKSFPKWNIYRSRVKRKTRRNHGGNFTTHLEDQAVYRYQRKFHHSANNSIPFLFFPFLFRSWQTFHSNLHYFNATDITLLLLLLFSTWDINPPQIFNSLSSNRATTFRDSFLLEIYGTAFCAYRSILSRIFHYATCKDD